MRFSIGIQLPGVSIGVEAEGDRISAIIPKLEACKEEIGAVVTAALAIRASAVPQLSQVPASGRARQDQFSAGAEEFIGDHQQSLQDGSHVDQLIAILYAGFRSNPESSLASSETAAAFQRFGFLPPVNPRDTIAKATRKGLITPAGEGARGRYRLTVPGRRHAEKLLGIQG